MIQLRKFIVDTQDLTGSTRPQTYTQWVYFLRKALPLIGLVFVVVLILWPGLLYMMDQLKTEEIPQISEKMILENKVLKPTMVSLDEKGRPIKVAAESAVQVQDKQVALETPQNQLELDDGTVLSLKADKGDFNQDAGILTYRGKVTMTTTQGYQFETQEAAVSIKEGRVQGHTPIAGTGPMGQIHSDQGFEVNKADQTITFKGHTHLILKKKK